MAGVARRAPLTHVYEDAKRVKLRTTLRPCLGWCGKKIVTTKYVRFCKQCADRKNSFSAGVDENEHVYTGFSAA